MAIMGERITGIVVTERPKAGYGRAHCFKTHLRAWRVSVSSQAFALCGKQLTKEVSGAAFLRKGIRKQRLLLSIVVVVVIVSFLVSILVFQFH